MMILTAFAYFQDGGQTENPFWFSTLIPMLFFFGLLYFLILRPQMRQQKDHRSLIDNLKKGDQVITNGGIWGEIDTVDPQFVRLKVNDKTKITVSRSAISGKQPSGGGEKTS